MNLRLSKVKLNITSLTNRPRKIKNTHPCFKSKSHTGSKVGIAGIGILTVITTPAAISESIEIRVLPNQVSKLRSTNHKLGQVLAFFIKTS